MKMGYRINRRSCRLFIILVHLFGVSTHLPTGPGIKQRTGAYHSGWGGPVGVNTQGIRFEREIQVGDDGNLEILDGDVYWLQDDTDGRCLGPTGFSECGDTTLWLLQREKINSKKRKGEKREGEKREGEERKGMHTLFRRERAIDASVEVSDSDSNAHNASAPLGTPYKLHSLRLFNIENEFGDLSEATERGLDTSNPFLPAFFRWIDDQRDSDAEDECLAISKKSLKASRGRNPPLQLNSCLKENAYKWHIDSRGVLNLALRKSNKSRHADPLRDDASHHPIDNRTACLSRNGTDVLVSSCDIGSSEINTTYPVAFSLVSYKHIYASEEERNVIDIAPDVEDPASYDEDGGTYSGPGIPRAASLLTASHPILLEIPSSQTLTSAHPSRGSMLLKNSNPILVGISADNLSSSSRPSRGTQMLAKSNPILHGMGGGSKDSTRSLSGLSSQKPISSDSSAPTGSRIKSHKMPVNPYFESADAAGKWEDPATSLVYETDLSSYLGDNKSEGRQVLVGVGQYTRTVFNVKVYGVGVYVSESDIFVDPQLVQFVGLTSDELREEPSFYEILHNMGDSSKNSVGFDRTILVKLNMQLSTDTMRASLDADWKLMTQEQKTMLINSSLKPRPADEGMLKTIQNKENSSRCACGQFAPEEYQADSTCCARGTEMVFTWRKNKSLEVRIDGRIMDIFPDPSLGRAIFYDYTREDDPISPDTFKRIPDGFPSLLAPLGQIPGVAATFEELQEKPAAAKSKKKPQSSFAGVLKGISSHAAGASERMQDFVVGTAQGVIDRGQALGGSIHRAGGHLDGQRRAIADAAVHAVTSFVGNIPFVGRGEDLESDVDVDNEDYTEWSGGKLDSARCDFGNVVENDVCNRMGASKFGKEPSGHINIGEAEPSITFSHKVVLMIVHLYLVLLLIVSLPGDTVNCNLVIRRKRKSYEADGEKAVHEGNGFKMDDPEKNHGNMKKSLSYFL